MQLPSDKSMVWMCKNSYFCSFPPYHHHHQHVATDDSYQITGIITQFHQSDTTTSDKLLDDFDQRT